MALQETQISFKFAGGVETKMDEKAVPAARLLALENGVFTKAISIQKRNGYEALSKTVDGTDAPYVDARALATRGDELLLLTRNRCYSRHSAADRWTDAGPAIAAVGKERPAVHTGTQQTMPDHATSAGVTVYAWEDSRGGVWWSVVDATHGGIYRAPAQIDPGGERPRCVAVGDVLHVYYALPAQRSLMTVIINPATPGAAPTVVQTVTDLDEASPAYDACPTTRTGAPALLAWHEFATSNVRVGYIAADGALGGPLTGHPIAHRIFGAAADTPLAVAYRASDGATADFVALAYVSSSGQGIAHTLDGGAPGTQIGDVEDSAKVAYATPVDVQRVAIACANERAWVAFEEAAAEPSERYTVTNSAALASPDVGVERTIRSVGLASRAFQAGHEDDVFATFVHDTVYFNTYLVLRLSDFAPAGRFAPASAFGAPTRPHLPSAQISGDTVEIALPYKTRLESETSDRFGEASLAKVTLDFAGTCQTAQLGRGLYLAAACPQHYDGRVWTEQGFHVGPERVVATPGSSGPGGIADGTYLYKVWYEWTDAQGEIHRGPESPGVSVELSGQNQVTLAIPTLRVTRKENVRICVARSLSGDTSRLWRVSSLDPTTAGAAANGYLANDPTVDSVSFVDRMSNVNLQKEEPIYTTGGIYSNDPAPLGSAITAGKTRLFFTDSTDGTVVRFSKRVQPGFGAELVPEFAHDTGPAGGDIVALATMDSVVYAFKRTAIYAFNGDGPLENGAGQSFSEARLLPGNVGCVDPGSIVEIPAGLMFKSEQGVWLVDRALNLQYIGAPVEAYNTQDVRNALVMPGRSQVALLTSSGRTLLYDYLFGQWSTFTNHEGIGAAVIGGVYHYLRKDGTVYRETPGRYSDAGVRIRLRLETAWLHLFDHLQGFQRFWSLLLLGSWLSPHQLGIQYRTDYNDEWSDPSWLDATGDTDPDGWLSGGGVAAIGEDPIRGTAYGDGPYGDGPYGGRANDVYQWRFGIHEHGQSVQFRFEDFEKSGLAGASFELTEMTITGGAKRQAKRPFSGARST